MKKPWTIYISNAFSLSMLDREQQNCDPRYGDVTGRLPRYPCPVDDPVAYLSGWDATGQVEVKSLIGHADTAALFSGLLGRPLPVNRVSVKLGKKELLLVGQYLGPRLPEGATELPAGATIEWWVI